MTSSNAEQLLADFLVRHRGMLLRYAHEIVRPTQRFDPEDVLQAASLNFYRYAQKRQQACNEPELLGLAIHCIKSALNEQLRWLYAEKRRAELRAEPTPTSGVAPAAPVTGPATAAVRNERKQTVHRLMQQLAPVARQILQLRFEDEQYYTFARIATVLGQNENAVRMRYNRALEKMEPQLRILLKDDSILNA